MHDVRAKFDLCSTAESVHYIKDSLATGPGTAFHTFLRMGIDGGGGVKYRYIRGTSLQFCLSQVVGQVD